MTGLQRKYSAAAAACLVCGILWGHPWPVAHGFTTWTAVRLSPGRQAWDRSLGFPLQGSTLVAPSETKEKTVSNNKNKASPDRRRAQNKQFLLKKWKNQQASANKKKATAERKQQDTQSQLVSVLGMSVSSIEAKAKTIAKPKKKKQQSTTQATEEKPKIWNTPLEPLETTTSPPKKTNSPKSSNKKGLLSWLTLVPGSTLSGKVVKALPYGVLVQTGYDIPGKTPGRALLHNHHFLDADEPESATSNIQPQGTTTTKKKQLLPVGSEIVKARVIHLNRDKGTLHISLRPPDKRMAQRTVLQVGDQVEGKVVRLQPYGAFVDVGHKRNALLHLSRMSMYKVHKITDHVRVGETIGVRVLRVTDKDLAVSLLSKENDAFVDRRELQVKRMALWQQVVHAAQADDDDDGKDLERAKRELLEVDRIIWDQFMAHDHGAPRSVEV